MTESTVRELSPDTLREAAAVLADGGLVALPTLTNYGLFCDPFNAQAIDRLFEAKRRTKFGPLSLFVAEAGQAERYVEVPATLRPAILEKVWPAPTALVMRRAYPFPPRLTLGLPTLAVCCQGPGSPLQDVLELLGRPLGASSANLSGQGAIDVTFDVTVADLGDRVDLIVDEGQERRDARPPQAHPGNTIIDLTFDPPHLVRHGFVDPETLAPYFPGLDRDTSGYAALLEERRSALASPTPGPEHG
ncbi:L-threonylcarbamoyladenylate synthase [Streptomyces sp. NBC_01190]|uniref:L-threonylcarbamoyladenylate synthase n=1 Tax=Streptomyces sp. NBC_01190 TaxID=2903767 RepID=UPI00386B09E1|nr:L-threonylcarbamoyladenylate synthase [Streptomyces sp. NBC_01190]